MGCGGWERGGLVWRDCGGSLRGLGRGTGVGGMVSAGIGLSWAWRRGEVVGDVDGKLGGMHSAVVMFRL